MTQKIKDNFQFISIMFGMLVVFMGVAFSYGLLTQKISSLEYGVNANKIANSSLSLEMSCLSEQLYKTNICLEKLVTYTETKNNVKLK